MYTFADQRFNASDGAGASDGGTQRAPSGASAGVPQPAPKFGVNPVVGPVSAVHSGDPSGPGTSSPASPASPSVDHTVGLF